MKIAKYTLTAVALMAAMQGAAHAESVSGYIEKQKDLESLDHTMARMERLVNIKKARSDLESVDTQNSNADRPKTESKNYNYSNGEADSAEAVAKAQKQKRAEQEKMEAERKKEEAERARKKEIGLITSAEIVEVFRDNAQGGAYGAVIDLGGAKQEVYPGTKISSWTITRITLDEITAKSGDLGGVVRRIKQLR